MKLVFIEHIDELNVFLRYLHEKKLKLSEFNIVALSTRVQVVLIKRKIRFQNTLSYFKNESHRNCLLKSDSIVQFLNKELQVNGKLHIDGHKNWYIFLIRHLMNHILWLIEIVYNAVNEIRPTEILLLKNRINNYSGPFINEDERYLPLLVNEICLLLGYSVSEIKYDKCLSSNSGGKYSKFLRYVSEVSFMNPISMVRGFGRVAKATFLGLERIDRLKKDKTLLVLALNFNLDRVCKEIKKLDNSINVVCLHDSVSIFKLLLDKQYNYVDCFVDYKELPAKVGTAEKRDADLFFCHIDKNQDIFAYRNVDCFKIIKSKIVTGITKDTENLIEKSYQMSYLIEAIRPNLSLSYSGRNLTYILGELCRNNDLEALCASHGSVVPPKNEIEEIVNRNIGESVILNKYPSVAVQTPLTEEFLDHYEHSSESIITGPLIFNRKSNMVHSDKTINILHAVTLKARNSLKFWGVEHEDEFISSISDLINIVDGINGIKLVIKLHPSFFYNFNKRDLYELLPRTKSYIISDRTIQEELSAAGLVISFSSTVIEEALINKIPVLLYDKWDRYQHYKALDLMDKSFKPFPLYYISSRKILEENLDTIIAKGLSSEINPREWDKYSYPESVKQNYYNYLNRCLTC